MKPNSSQHKTVIPYETGPPSGDFFFFILNTKNLLMLWRKNDT